VLLFIYFCGSTVLIRTRASLHMRFLELFRHMVGLLGRVISPSQGLYLHRITQHRKTRANIHALSGIRTHDPSNQPAKTHASDRTATVTLCVLCIGNYSPGKFLAGYRLPLSFNRNRYCIAFCHCATFLVTTINDIRNGVAIVDYSMVKLG
jgi:hypothetical protein